MRSRNDDGINVSSPCRENTGREKWQRYWPNTRSGGDYARAENDHGDDHKAAETMLMFTHLHRFFLQDILQKPK